MKTKLTTPPPLSLDHLEQSIAYKFRNPALLERALTHRSWAHEEVGPGEEEKARCLHNESLEFLGDAALDLIVADFLFRAYPNVTEGELSRMKHRLVSAPTLCKASRRLGIGDHLRMGRGEEKSGGRRKRALLADAFEAILCAVFLDGGLPAAVNFVEHALAAELETVDPEEAAAADFKTMLQERLQAECHATPEYTVVETMGPPHKRTFRVEVNWSGGRMTAEGRSIKDAETRAARAALERIGVSQAGNAR